MSLHRNVLRSPVSCMQRLKRRLTDPTETVSREEAFTMFLLFKMLAFAASSVNDSTLEAYQDILPKVVLLAEDKQHQLSYQLIHDLIGELFRLCFEAKLIFCRKQSGTGSVLIQKEEQFLRQHDSPTSRMSKKEFTSHSKILDIISRHRFFQSTNDLVGDINYFLPPVFSGSWQACKLGHYYYCMPVCKEGNIRMECQECTGTDVCISGMYCKCLDWVVQ